MRGQKHVSAKIVIMFCFIWVIGFTYAIGYWPLLSQSDEEILTVEHEIYNFAVDYQGKYVARKYESGYRRDEERKLLISRTSQDDIYISFTYREAKNPTLDDILEWRNEKFSFARDGIMNPKDQVRIVNLDNYKAWELDYFYENGIAVNEVYLLRENDMFIITLQARVENIPNYKDDFKFILNSFRSLEN